MKPEQAIYMSIVIPLFNEEGNLKLLSSELLSVIGQINPSFELIFVDDGSKDRSLEILHELCQQDPRIKGISLSRNFGHQIALTAGLQHAKGELVVTMDADMQHPPELIPTLHAKYLEGFDIVNTIRVETADSSLFKKVTSKWFYKLINSMSDIRIEPASADFRLMNRKTVDAFLQLSEKDRFTRGLISWMGFRQAMVDYVAPSRFSGKSKYSLGKMIRFASDGVTSFSAKPLRISFYAGFIISMIGLIYALYAVIQHVRGNTTQGWTSILVSVLIIGGIQLISIGIIGEYLARVFNEAKKRPLYFVKEYISKNDEE